MIQRIQSVWFLLASISAFLSLKFPFFIGTNKDHEASYQLNGMENIYLMLMTILIGTLSFVTIFLFKKRRRQVRLAVVGIGLELVLILLYYFHVRTFIEKTGAYALTALLQGCVLFFLFLALRGIGNDIKVIKESDRLR